MGDSYVSQMGFVKGREVSPLDLSEASGLASDERIAMQGFSGSDETKQLGRKGEDLAATFLLGKGFRLLERNYRCRLGEIDLIAQGADRLFFVEVKTRRRTDAVSPRELISRGKQRHISRVAQYYVAAKKLHNVDADFAVLIVDLSGLEPRFEWIENAFPLCWGY